MPDIDQFQKLLGVTASTPSPVTVRGIDRYEMGSIPAQSCQKNWRYLLTKDGDSRMIHLDGGNGRTFSFRFDGEPVAPEQFSSGTPISLTRLGDSTRHEKNEAKGETVSKGVIQVHKSTPTSIHATLQDGKSNSTVMFEQGDDGWTMRTAPKKKRLAEVAGNFAKSLSKQAIEKDDILPFSHTARAVQDGSHLNRNVFGVDRLGGPGVFPSSANPQRGFHTKVPGVVAKPVSSWQKFISTTPLKTLMPSSQMDKVAGGTWRLPENHDTLSDSGLPDSSWVMYVGCNDWECGVTWAGVYRQKDVTKSGVSGATPRVWVEIDHNDCPGCDSAEHASSPRADCKTKCNDFGRKVARRWVREANQGGSGSLEDRLYSAARIDPDIKSYGRAPQKTAAFDQALNYGLLGAGAGGVLQMLRGSFHQGPEKDRPSILNGMLLGGLTGAAAGGLMPGQQPAAAPAVPVQAPLTDAQINEVLSGSQALVEAQHTYGVHVMHHKGFAPSIKDLGNGNDMKGRGGTLMVPGVWNASDAVPAPTPLHGYQYTMAPFARGAEPAGSAILAHSPNGPSYLSLLNNTKGGLIGMSATPTWEISAQHAAALQGLLRRGNISMDDLTPFSPEKMPSNKLINNFQRPVVPPPPPPPAPVPMIKSGAAPASYLQVLCDKFRVARKDVHLTPSEAQQEAGNYRKGHVWMNGFDITIENPKGSTRSGTARDGTKWKTTLAADYGDIRNYPRSKADGDNMDVFVGPHPSSEMAYVIDQYIDGKFDEHKIVLGCFTEKEARAIYQDSFDENWKGLGDVTALTIRQLKSWLKDGDTSKPLHGQSLAKHVKTAMEECEREEKLAADNSWMPAPIADAFNSPFVSNTGLAAGSGALRGAVVAALIHGVRTLKRENLDQPKRDLNLTRDLALGSAIGAGSGLLLHYTPEILEFAHNTLGTPKAAHVMDIPLAPLHMGGIAGTMIGTGYGAIVGAVQGTGGKIKRFFTGEPEENQFEDDVLNGAQQGLNIGSMASLNGMNPASMPALQAAAAKSKKTVPVVRSKIPRYIPRK